MTVEQITKGAQGSAKGELEEERANSCEVQPLRRADHAS
jgi:hypothetical protein